MPLPWENLLKIIHIEIIYSFLDEIINKLAKLGDAIVISKSETMHH